MLMHSREMFVIVVAMLQLVSAVVSAVFVHLKRIALLSRTTDISRLILKLDTRCLICLCGFKKFG